MHLAVLAAADSWYLKDIRRAAAGRHRVTQVDFARLTSVMEADRLAVSSFVADGQEAVELMRCDCVLVRTMPAGSLEQVVFRMDALSRLDAGGVRVVNPPKAIETAVDKYLTTARLQAAGLRVPRTIVCQTADDAMQAFVSLGGDVVVKPIFGAEGRGIARLNDDAMALRAFKLLADLRAVIYLQEYLPHEGCDLRLFVLGEEVFGMRRRNPADWRTNVSRGAKTEAFTTDAALCEMALRAARAVGAPVAGVDLLPGRDGHIYAIEVNAVPGWKALSRTLDIDIAARVLDYVATTVG